MPVSYKKAIAWGKRKFAEGYASGRRSRIQWSDLTANVAEILNLDRCIMKVVGKEVAVTGRLTVFYIPCGECGNPLALKEVYPAALLLECCACGLETETDRLPLTEACGITIDANEFNAKGDRNEYVN